MQAINGKLYAFVTLERAGGVMVYDVTDPANASFVSYEPPAPFSGGTPIPADNAPETVISISAADSPMGVPLVVTANEVGNATTVYAAVTTIPTIQGTGHTSSFVGQTVTTLGVVTAVDTNGSRGFYIQDANGDGDAATSDAIFVFLGGSGPLSVSPGQLVSVTGLVGEFTPNGAAPGAFSGTQIDARASAGGVINALGTGPAIEAVVIGGEDGLQVPSTSFADASAFYESMEGMLVTVKEAVVIGPTNDFGEIYAVVDNDADRGNGVNGAELNSRGALLLEGGAAGLRQHRPCRRQLPSRTPAGRRRQRRAGRLHFARRQRRRAAWRRHRRPQLRLRQLPDRPDADLHGRDAEHAGEGNDGARRHSRPADGRKLQRRKSRSERRRGALQHHRAGNHQQSQDPRHHCPAGGAGQRRSGQCR